MRRNYHNTTLLVILLLVGLVIGDVIGTALGKYLPFLAQGNSVGLSTTTLDLGVITLTLGFKINLNLAGVVGLIIAILLYQKMY